MHKELQAEVIDSATSCQILGGISPSTLSRWVKAGKIQPIIKGAGLRGPMWFRRSDVEKLAEAQRVAA